MRVGYALAGAAVAVLIDLALNLLVAILQVRTPVEQFSQISVGWLVVLIVAGLLAGVWLSGKIAVPLVLPSPTTAAGEPQQITRLAALLSYGRLRGQGIRLGDILLIGSVLDIDTHTMDK